MPIDEFEIDNVAAIKYAKCTNVPRIMIITGPNGVGKSTLLEEITRHLQGTRRRNVKIKTSNSPKPVYLPPHRAPSRASIHKSLPFVAPRRKYRDILGLEHFSFDAPGIGFPYPLGSGQPRSRFEPDALPYFEAKFRMTQLELDFRDALTELYRKHKEVPRESMPDIYRPLKDAVKQLLPGLDFDQIVIEGDTYKVYFTNRIGERVEFDYLSSGEKDILALVFTFIEKRVERELSLVKGESISGEDLVFLIDTPEAYLHPELQTRFLKYARNLVKSTEDALQFLIATHSTTIINQTKPEELYVLLFPDQVENNQLERISSEEYKLHVIQDILGDIGLAALSAGKPILLLEGKSDVEILELLRPDMREFFILRFLGGKGKVLSFIGALEHVIPELLARGFKIFAILDKDSGSIVKNNKGIVFTWSVVCMENFLLADYDVLHKALGVVAGKEKLSSLNIHSKKDVKKLVKDVIRQPEIIDQLVKAAGRYMKIAYDEIQGLDEEAKKGKILRAFESWNKRIERRKDEVAKITNDVDRALKELNGKLILHALAKKIGINSEYLARSIADKMREMERVPSEITDLLQSIIEL